MKQSVIHLADISRFNTIKDDVAKRLLDQLGVKTHGKRRLGRGWQYDYLPTELEKAGFAAAVVKYKVEAAKNRAANLTPSKAPKKSLEARLAALESTVTRLDQPRGPGARFR